jgi:3-oxoacyl-[acyl-carrier protein] reductase
MGRLMLSGQTILVTGATGAIGQAICTALVADGARVLIHCSQNRPAAENMLAKLNHQGWIINGDLSDPATPPTLWAEATAKAGRIHALVNNAGIRSEVAVDAPIDQWQATWAREMRINFLAAADLSREAILHFRHHGGGRILNMASRAGQRGYSAHAMAYGASKAALINLTKSIAQSYG